MFRYLFILLLSYITAYSQNADLTLGARATGSGNTISTQNDSWSTFNNVAGLAYQKDMDILLSYRSQYGLSELGTAGLGLVIPLKTGAFGLSIYRFGGELFSRQKVGIGYANKFGLASIGIRANYLQYSIENHGSNKVLTFDFGGMAELTPQLLFGAYIFNLTQQKIAEFEDETIPIVMSAGLSYQATKKLKISVEVKKNIDFDATVLGGIEYSFLSKFQVRTGFSSQPSRAYFGLGFTTKKLNIDYAFNMQSFLGSAHQLSLGYKVKTKRP